ncbi:hypothetical protein RWE15_00940 [Virgibacillus halophilus]|uniref:Uncharacterized protein n=1 Tax=Tigheibacillus halophilus TaxID=361280 RepID=A0ABU5C1S4_9BACI|nr:hypothetical protein [Virgibacillus halophilus]
MAPLNFFIWLSNFVDLHARRPDKGCASVGRKGRAFLHVFSKKITSCGVFRLVLDCDYASHRKSLFPLDKERFGSIHIAQKKRISFSRSQPPFAPTNLM